MPGTFWHARPVLKHLHQAARARMTSPEAVLGAALARAACCIPPNIVLPRLVGSWASLNTFVGQVGGSGVGKGAAGRVAHDAIHWPDEVVEVGPGSGEGLAHLFVRIARDGKDFVQEQYRTAVLVDAAEVDSLVALGARRGATLIPELRKAWSAEHLGAAYADPTKRLIVRAHSYRLALVVGVQPGRAAPLLDDAAGGTPQRIIWLPCDDPTAPDTPPDDPGEYRYRLPVQWGAGHTGRLQIDVASAVYEEVQQAQRGRLRAGLNGHGSDDLSGHDLLAKLKIAAILGNFEERYSITDEDWQLAGEIMATSLSVRRYLTRYLAVVAGERERSRGRAEHVRETSRMGAHAESVTVAAAAFRRIVDRHTDDELHSQPGCTRACFSRGAPRHRALRDEAIEECIDRDWLTFDGERYLPGVSRRS